MRRNRETISAALGLTDEWVDAAEGRVESLMTEMDTVSEVMLEMVNGTKEEEFGAGEWNLTPYEKKLVMVGLLVSQALVRRSIMQTFAGELLGFDRNDEDDND